MLEPRSAQYGKHSLPARHPFSRRYTFLCCPSIIPTFRHPPFGLSTFWRRHSPHLRVRPYRRRSRQRQRASCLSFRPHTSHFSSIATTPRHAPIVAARRAHVAAEPARSVSTAIARLFQIDSDAFDPRSEACAFLPRDRGFRRGLDAGSDIGRNRQSAGKGCGGGRGE